MHLAVFFKLVKKKPKSDVFGDLSKPQQLYCRKLIIEAVLSTDMAQHFDIVSELGLLVEEIASLESKAPPSDDGLQDLSGSDDGAECAREGRSNRCSAREETPAHVPAGRGTALWRAMQDVDNKFLLLSGLVSGWQVPPLWAGEWMKCVQKMVLCGDTFLASAK